jgi:hypothetical protein
MSVTYSNDIRPKFRPGDVACMTPRGVKIGDANWMCDAAAGNGFDDHGNARRVYSAVSEGFMPPDEAWPQDWLQVYQTWMDEGFQT